MSSFPAVVGPIVDTSKVGGDPDTGVQALRDGALAAQGWRCHRVGITAAESLNDVTLLGSAVPAADFPFIEWLVLMPAGATSYTIEAVRYIYVPASTDRTQGHTLQVAVNTQTFTGETTSKIFIQNRQRDPADVRITATAGVISGAPAGVAKDVNPAGLQNGYQIWYRPATSAGSSPG